MRRTSPIAVAPAVAYGADLLAGDEIHADDGQDREDGCGHHNGQRAEQRRQRLHPVPRAVRPALLPVLRASCGGDGLCVMGEAHR